MFNRYELENSEFAYICYKDKYGEAKYQIIKARYNACLPNKLISERTLELLERENFFRSRNYVETGN